MTRLRTTALVLLVASAAAVGCTSTPPNPVPPPAPMEPIVQPELTQNLALCGNRTPMAEFRADALPWFATHAELATPELIALVHRGGGSTERAAIALGHIGATSSVPALEEALTGDLITHQSAAARALWAIGGPQADAALTRAIQGAGSPAKRVLQAIAPLEERSPCALIALAASEPTLAAAAELARERCGC